MKVALIGPVYPYRGGIAHHTALLDGALRRADHDVLLISFSRQYPRWLFPGRSDRDPSAQPLHQTDARYWLDSLNPLTWLATFRRISRYRPHLLVIPWWTTFWFPLWLTLALLNQLFLRSTLVFFCHNVLPHDASRMERWLARLLLRHGDQFIVQSTKESERLQALLPHLQNAPNATAIRIVPHPIYTAFHQPVRKQKLEQKDARVQLDLPQHELILLFFGLVREYKGLDILLRALPHVHEFRPGTKLVVAGEFWRSKQSYFDLIDALKLRESVILHDYYIPNEMVSTYFASADVLVAPYRSITGSGVLQVAAGLGLPIIGSKAVRASFAGENSEPGKAPPTTPQELAAEIIAFAQGDTSQALGPSVRVEEQAAEASWQRTVNAIVGRSPEPSATVSGGQ